MDGAYTSWRDLKGKALQGTCGWTDPSILQCGKFYPPWVKTSEDRLAYYSTVFPCVECDTSSWAIPSPVKVKNWTKKVPNKFIFHFKAYTFFTWKFAATNTIPRAIRAELSEQLLKKENISWDDLPPASLQKLWEMYNACVRPAYDAGKLGVIIFQFHLNFNPTEENRRHVLVCRRFLDSKYRMAVEFRCRKWLGEGELERTVSWLRHNDIGLVCVDELEHELFSLPTPEKASDVSVMPIVHALGSTKFCYVRVHRRAGKQRLLTSANIISWADRLTSEQFQSCVEGPVFFMWGTAHEDQPVINSKNLATQLGSYSYDWKRIASKAGAIMKFCVSQATTESKDTKEIEILSGPTVHSEQTPPKVPKLETRSDVCQKTSGKTPPKSKKKTLHDFFSKSS